jgi:hypothetical protein
MASVKGIKRRVDWPLCVTMACASVLIVLSLWESYEGIREYEQTENEKIANPIDQDAELRVREEIQEQRRRHGLIRGPELRR